MNKIFVAAAATLTLAPLLLGAQDKDARVIDEVKLKPYGFVRNYMIFDTRDVKTGTQDIYYYGPKDYAKNADGDDANGNPNWHFAAITTRLGLDIAGPKVGKAQFGGKIEADFYLQSGSAAVMRLRQAYLTSTWNKLGREGDQKLVLLMGQAWHPLAADQPNSISLETGMPFAPFSRTPQIKAEWTFAPGFSLTGALLSQMQYLSTGPAGTSQNYIKYSMLPEAFLSLSYKSDGGFLGRIGVDVLSIKPRWRYNGKSVDDRLTTVSPFAYAQYTSGKFQIKAKTVLAEAGEHLNLLSGYGVSKINTDGSYDYTPMQSSVSFISAQYGGKLKVLGMVGYIKQLGTRDELVSDGSKLLFWLHSKNEGNFLQGYRLTPTLTYSVGKHLTLGFEYDNTGFQYGKTGAPVQSKNGLVESGKHWVVNNRFLFLTKLDF